MSVTIRYAETDADIIAIHRFLCVVMGPTLPGPIGAKESATEVWRVVKHDLALMAMKDDRLVGTIGIVRPTWWWNTSLPFLANRWLACLPGSHAILPLLREATAIAIASKLELHIFDENKGRITIFNRSEKRHVFRKRANLPDPD
jgi:hypothetical protein